MFSTTRIQYSKLALLVALASFICVGSADAAFVVKFDPNMTTIVSNGTTQTVSVDLLIDYMDDGNPNTLSAYTFNITDPGTGLTFTNPLAADYAWDFGPSLSMDLAGDSQVLSSNFSSGNFVVPEGSTRSLMTLDFVVDGSVIDQTFPLNLSVLNASRNLFTDIESEFSFDAGQFVVTSVPEPSTASVLALGVGLCTLRRRKRSRQTNRHC
ncbi:hypothetical protein CA13_44510 [Planctomycetes bacterium CA13]|uniref:Uncharacterized protein n=1 Tax=Novipirellula herctigrandis TaxID=2527986 RepID=A0A5C5Z6V3_9BACT|nr:hypothetical protein CA13_44510 [Planctomycetes bacterium CA13]